MKALEICRLAKIPQGRVYDTLKSLEEQGLVSVLSTDPKTFQAINPKIALASLLNQKKSEINNLLLSIPNIKIPKKTERTPDEPRLFEVITGRPTHMEIIKKFKEEAKKEVFQMSHNYVGTSVSQQASTKMLRKNINFKLIVNEVCPENRKRLKKELKEGAKIRINKSTNTFSFVVKDREEALISIGHSKNKKTVIKIQNSTFAKALVKIFMDNWKRSTPLVLN